MSNAIFMCSSSKSCALANSFVLKFKICMKHKLLFKNSFNTGMGYLGGFWGQGNQETVVNLRV
jgi:hypothetical protein